VYLSAYNEIYGQTAKSYNRRLLPKLTVVWYFSVSSTIFNNTCKAKLKLTSAVAYTENTSHLIYKCILEGLYKQFNLWSPSLRWDYLIKISAYPTALSCNETAVQMLNSFVVQIYFCRLTKAILSQHQYNFVNVRTNANILDIMITIRTSLSVTIDCNPWSQPIQMICGHGVSRHLPPPSTRRQPNKFPYIVAYIKYRLYTFVFSSICTGFAKEYSIRTTSYSL
jgi:hypothetical protein